ncbi:hypothetical protein Hanom_Chr10g00953381 [Helianthus anomalus]
MGNEDGVWTHLSDGRWRGRRFTHGMNLDDENERNWRVKNKGFARRWRESERGLV